MDPSSASTTSAPPMPPDPSAPPMPSDPPVAPDQGIERDFMGLIPVLLNLPSAAQIQRMDGFVTEYNLRHFNESNSQMTQGINMAILCCRRIGQLANYNTVSSYGPFRYYYAKLFHFIFERIDQFLDLHETNRWNSDRTFGEIGEVLEIFDIYVKCCVKSSAIVRVISLGWLLCFGVLPPQA